MTKPTAGELTGTSSQATSQLDNRNAFTGVSKQGLNRWKKYLWYVYPLGTLLPPGSGRVLSGTILRHH
ncbi:hypothetical protein [uncultured Vibrio sp.]|uniref:hypothetical protein n=1 Tax=Vibrio sp. TaxID=678 RepID=UPI0029C67FB6|nr:hypothetical protein [uncultured Vibrio sp.]